MSILCFIVVGIYIVEVTGFFCFAVKFDKPSIIEIGVRYLPLYATSIALLVLPYIQLSFCFIYAFIDVLFTLMYVHRFLLYMRLKNKH